MMDIKSWFSFIHSKVFQRWSLISLLFLAISVGFLAFAVYSSAYESAAKSLASAESVIENLTNQNLRLKSNYNEAQQTVVKKEQDLQTKDVELDKAKTDLDQAKKDLEGAKIELTKVEKQLSSYKAQISNQEAQLATNSSELEQLRQRPPLFSFQNQSSRNVDEDKKEVEEVVKVAYDEINSVYSTPYLLHSVSITFVESLGREGATGSISITNSDKGLDMEIKITSFDKDSFISVNTIIHEIIHSFHGLATLSPVAFEEGITVATTDQVMKNLADQGKLPRFSRYYIALSQDQYNGYNSDANFKIPAEYSAFYGAQASVYYQVEGYAWQKLASSNPNFYKSFNEKFYSKIRNGESASADLVRQVIKETVSSVDGQSIDDFLNSNKAFQPS